MPDKNVFLRGKTWYIRYDEPIGTDGKRKQKMVACPGMTKKQAEQKRRDVLTSINNGAYVLLNASKTMLSDFLRQWLNDYAKTNTSLKTYERYVEVVEKHLIPNLGHYMLKDLKATHLNAYYAEAVKSGRLIGKKTKELSKRTVLMHHRILSNALERAVEWELIYQNPAHKANPPRPDEEEMATLNVEQVEKLLVASQNTPFNMPIFLAVTTGMRRGEILALRWEDIDFDAGVIYVKRTVSKTKASGLILKEPKTRSSRRAIKVGKAIIDRLREHREHVEITRLALGEVYQDQGYVCQQEDGSIIPPDYLSKRFHELFSGRHGVPVCTFHSLRHTNASFLAKHKISLKVIQERLGHSTPRTTLATYTHIFTSMQEEAAEAIDDILGRK